MRALGLALLGLLLMAAPASATTYTVIGTGDAAGACDAAGNCTTLRAAVSRANQDQTADTISLPAAATYTLTQTPEVTIGTNMAITGAGARSTVIFAASGARVFTVNGGGGNLTLSHVTLTGGTGTQGGDILNQGVLTLDHARVTGGTASASGGGIANVGGSLTGVNSLIDGNTVSGTRGLGGGIVSAPGSGTTVIPARVSLTNTTVAFNQITGGGGVAGAGIAVTGSASTATLTSVTLARNTATSVDAFAAGLYDGTTGNVGSVTTAGSIIAQNFSGGGSTLNNCGNTGFDPRDQIGVGQASLTDGSDCGFVRVADPVLDASPSNQGGETNVLAIPATSPAKRLVADCPVASDQRDAPRQVGGACDAGAYEQITPPPPPQPTVSPTPTPTPTATSPPAPVFHKNVVVRPVSGKVRVKLPGTNKFVDLDVTQGVPLGSTIDVKHGKIALTSVPKPGGKPQTALFYGGIFKLTQPGGITQLQLTEPLAVCPRRHHAAAAAAAAARKKPKTRSLWGDGHGAFRTKGQYSAATVRGTKWFVRDSCAGTLTRVVRGVVSVRDEVRHKTLTLRAGKRYLAKPRR